MSKGKRLLWHSVGPWVHSGYGSQTRHWVPRVASLGYDVAIAATYGIKGASIMWEGFPVFPSGMDAFGMDVLPGHARRWDADLVITFADTWVMDPECLAACPCPVACWTPVDCDGEYGAGLPDRLVLEMSGARPIAVARFGEDMLRKAGLNPLYIPHGVDTATFRPPKEARAETPFVVGMNAANADPKRKGFDEAFQAFAAFQKKHPESVLLMNTLADGAKGGGKGIDLEPLAHARGIQPVWADRDAYLTGMFGDAALADWYGALDVLLSPSWAEGFGLPILEAQACGTPVIVTEGSAMRELCGAGWRVPGQRSWNSVHQADWFIPSVPGITRALEKAFTLAGRKRAQAREFAMAYDLDRVLVEYWKPALEELLS